MTGKERTIWLSQCEYPRIAQLHHSILFGRTTWASPQERLSKITGFFLFLHSANHGLPHAFQQGGGANRISRSFQGSTASCVAASKCWGRGGDFGGARFVVSNQKEEKNQCNKSPHFFFADRFGLISWLLLEIGFLLIRQSANLVTCFTCILIFNVTLMTL